MFKKAIFLSAILLTGFSAINTAVANVNGGNDFNVTFHVENINFDSAVTVSLGTATVSGGNVLGLFYPPSACNSVTTTSSGDNESCSSSPTALELVTLGPAPDGATLTVPVTATVTYNSQTLTATGSVPITIAGGKFTAPAYASLTSSDPGKS